jgi:Tfp pilus assembly protein PilP
MWAANINEYGPQLIAAPPHSMLPLVGSGHTAWVVVAQLPTDQPADNPVVATLPDATYRYNPQGRRDPFESLVKDRSQIPDLERVRIDPERPRGPLERFDLSALKLVGILQGQLGRRGLIRAPDDKGYFVTIGMYMGQNGGQITAIEPDRLVIEEKFKDTEGNIVGKTLTLPLRRKKENG